MGTRDRRLLLSFRRFSRHPTYRQLLPAPKSSMARTKAVRQRERIAGGAR